MDILKIIILYLRLTIMHKLYFYGQLSNISTPYVVALLLIRFFFTWVNCQNVSRWHRIQSADAEWHFSYNCSQYFIGDAIHSSIFYVCVSISLTTYGLFLQLYPPWILIRNSLSSFTLSVLWSSKLSCTIYIVWKRSLRKWKKKKKKNLSYIILPSSPAFWIMFVHIHTYVLKSWKKVEWKSFR